MNSFCICFQRFQISSSASRTQLTTHAANRLPDRIFNKSFLFIQAGKETPPLARIRQVLDNPFDMSLRMMP